MFLLPAFAFSEDPAASQGASTASAPIAHGDTDLRVLLREVGAAKDLTYPELLSILQVNGWLVVADDGLLQVIPNTEVRQAALPLVSPENIKTLDDEWITCVVPVKNISAAQLVPILRPLIPQWGHLGALVDRNALIIVDGSANVRRLVGIIRILESLPKAVDLQPQKAAEKP